MLVNSQFEKFIIKKIASNVTFDIKSMSVTLGNVVVSETSLKAIYNEGNNYGLSRSQVDQAIKLAQTRLNSNAIISPIYGDLKITDIMIDSHIRLQSKCQETIFIDLLYTGDGKFMVISSSGQELWYGDILVPNQRVFSLTKKITFYVFRGNKHLCKNYQYVIHYLSHIELLSASYLHQIYDSKTDFSIADADKIQITDSVTSTYYLSLIKLRNDYNRCYWVASDMMKTHSNRYWIKVTMLTPSIANYVIDLSLFKTIVGSERTLMARVCEFDNNVQLDWSSDETVEKLECTNAGKLVKILDITDGSERWEVITKAKMSLNVI